MRELNYTFLVVLMLSVFSSCGDKMSKEEKRILEEAERILQKTRDSIAWETATSTNTLSSYKTYLEQFSDGKWSPDADSIIDLYDLTVVIHIDSIECINIERDNKIDLIRFGIRVNASPRKGVSNDKLDQAAFSYPSLSLATNKSIHLKQKIFLDFTSVVGQVGTARLTLIANSYIRSEDPSDPMASWNSRFDNAVVHNESDLINPDPMVLQLVRGRNELRVHYHFERLEKKS